MTSSCPRVWAEDLKSTILIDLEQGSVFYQPHRDSALRSQEGSSSAEMCVAIGPTKGSDFNATLFLRILFSLPQFLNQVLVIAVPNDVLESL